MTTTRTGETPEKKQNTKLAILTKLFTKKTPEIKASKKKSMLVWIADDDSMQRKFLKTTFERFIILDKEKNKYSVTVKEPFKNSKEVCKAILEWKRGEPVPSVISLDNVMGDLPGIQLADVATLPSSTLSKEIVKYKESPNATFTLKDEDIASLQLDLIGKNYANLLEQIELMQKQHEAEFGARIRIIIVCGHDQDYKKVEELCNRLVQEGRIYDVPKGADSVKNIGKALSADNNPLIGSASLPPIKMKKKRPAQDKSETTKATTSTSKVLSNPLKQSKSNENMTKEDIAQSAFPRVLSDVSKEYTFPDSPMAVSPSAKSPHTAISPKMGFFSIAPTPETSTPTPSSFVTPTPETTATTPFNFNVTPTTSDDVEPKKMETNISPFSKF